MGYKTEQDLLTPTPSPPLPVAQPPPAHSHHPPSPHSAPHPSLPCCPGICSRVLASRMSSLDIHLSNPLTCSEPALRCHLLNQGSPPFGSAPHPLYPTSTLLWHNMLLHSGGWSLCLSSPQSVRLCDKGLLHALSTNSAQVPITGPGTCYILHKFEFKNCWPQSLSFLETKVKGE